MANAVAGILWWFSPVAATSHLVLSNLFGPSLSTIVHCCPKGLCQICVIVVAIKLIILMLISIYFSKYLFLFVDNYGSLKSDSTDGSGEADRIIIINKPQTQQFCNNKIRWDVLTLSLPRVPKIKIQDESQISFCKILNSTMWKYCWQGFIWMVTL